MKKNLEKSLKRKIKNVAKETKKTIEEEKRAKTGAEEYTEKAGMAYTTLLSSFRNLSGKGKRKLKENGLDEKKELQYIYVTKLITLYLAAIKNILSINSNTLSISKYLKLISEGTRKVANTREKVRQAALKQLVLKNPDMFNYTGKSRNADYILGKLKQYINSLTPGLWEEVKNKILFNLEINGETNLTVLEEYNKLIEKVQNREMKAKDVAALYKAMLANAKELEKFYKKVGIENYKILVMNYLARGTVLTKEFDITEAIAKNRKVLFVKRKGPQIQMLINKIFEEISQIDLISKNEDLFSGLKAINNKVNIIVNNVKNPGNKTLNDDISSIKVQEGKAYVKNLFYDELQKESETNKSLLTNGLLIKLFGGKGARGLLHIEKIYLLGESNSGNTITFESIGVKELKENIKEALATFKETGDLTQFKNGFALIKAQTLLENLDTYTKISRFFEKYIKLLQGKVIEGIEQLKKAENDVKKVIAKDTSEKVINEYKANGLKFQFKIEESEENGIKVKKVLVNITKDTE